MTFETFYAKVWKQGNSFIITIPMKVAKFAGYKIGDELKVMSRRMIESD